ncbi:hypothetical protein [Legionella sainthelensi]|uniref:Uncharacterized protein n=1 Tax=Legionella sainthelensi TaxID=28087 RepID=A0A2H5FRS9_9GAMM|nr:hypothetical protein [Legionella sainthelensi]AUH74265.1 hypothetical protein CAB17_20215 [Legionella sainthelensi]
MEFFWELWQKIKNKIISSKASTVNNTSFDGFNNNSGKIVVHTGDQINNYRTKASPQLDFDPVYKCYFFKGERVCSVCAPDLISVLKMRSLGSMSHFHCETCGKDFHKKGD